MAPGWYIMKKAILRVANITFMHEKFPLGKALMLPEIKEHPDSSIRAQSHTERFQVWPHTRSLEVEVSPTKHVNLSKSRSIAIKVFAGWNCVVSGHLTVRPASAGLRLYTSQVTVSKSENLEGDGKSTSGNIAFGNIDRDEELIFTIPYEFESEKSEINLCVDVEYCTDNGQYNFICKYKVPVGLALAVNVQDTFKKDILFSRFMIGSATPTPVRVLDYKVCSNEDFVAYVSASPCALSDTFMRHPLSLIAEIRRVARPRSSGSDDQLNRRLLLDIEYQCLDQYVMKDAEESMLKALATTEQEGYARLLCSHLTRVLHMRLSKRELEESAIVGNYVLGEYKSFGWEETLNALERADRVRLQQDLEDWHKVFHATSNLCLSY